MDKVEWKNETRGGEVVSSVAEIGCFRLYVHHYIGHGDVWFTSCYGVFDRSELGEMSLNQAQVMAGAKLQLKLEAALVIITGRSKK